MPKGFRAIFATAATALPGLLACSSNSSKSSSVGQDHDVVDAGPDTITILDFKYIPGNIAARPGSTIQVVNRDIEAHSVTSESKVGNFTLGAVQGTQFDTGPIDPGQDASFTIPQSALAGTVISYFCTVHTSTMMEGRVTVQ
jgi:plastocyanin